MTSAPPPAARVPDKPSLDGLEERLAGAWEAAGVYRFDRTRPRAEVYAIDTPPPTVSGALHIGHVFSYTHTDVIARFRRMCGDAVFYPMGWDDNGLPTERRVQNFYGVRCDPAVPYDAGFTPPVTPPDQPQPISRQNFIELCTTLTAQDEQAFEALWRRLGLSVDWSLTYTTVGTAARATSQRAFLRNLARGEAYAAEAPSLWDVTFRTAVAQAELEDRERPGAYHRIPFATADGTPVYIETTRPELLPACVALVTHPDDARYAALVGTTVTSPLFGVPVPVRAHRLADPEKGSGIAMICTWGDLTDVIWWRELDLPARAVLGRDGRVLADPPAGLTDPAGRERYATLAGATVHTARERVVAMLSDAGLLDGPVRPITHPVKFFEKGDKPLEIVSTRQWYLRNGGRDGVLRELLRARGRELTWVPPHMATRYDNWVEGLNGDWLVSRQRFFGVPVPVWYRVGADGETRHDDVLVPSEDALPVDPAVDCPPGYQPHQRDAPGGFRADPDVMDTWATSSLTPQIAGGWERDPDLFARVYPMDLRPQAHEIIRTWLFSTVVRAHAEFGALPWTTAQISGWVLDPDRKKMSKSKGNVVVPVALLDEHGSDAVRYWAAMGRPGSDTAADPGQMKVGRRLAIKVLNAAKFALGQGAGAVAHPPAALTALDRGLLAGLADVVDRATTALQAYDYTRALEATETFFWAFCDDYVELVKVRAYGETDPAGQESARFTLGCALDVLLRLFAPFLPFVTDEVWSWWQQGSVHSAAWPSAAPLRDLAGDADPTVLTVVGAALSGLRKAKSEARLSMNAEIDTALVQASDADTALLELARGDLCAAGRVAALTLEGGHDELRVQAELAAAS